MESRFKMVATTFAGLEEVLAKELTELGAEEVTVLKRAVSFFGDQRMMYKVNYECRCALRILKPVFEFYSENEEEFYKAIKEFKWWEVLDIKDTFAIDTVAFNSHLEHTQYITLKAKDAIADCFTDKMNRRPFVDVENPKLKVNIHLVDNNCSISFDSSGNPLFKRGYRYFTNEAPINEVLAAGLIKLTGWHGESNFMDPMCGSGTFLIEAAMVAQNIPAGYYRNEWGFMTWKDFDEALWLEVKGEADDKISEFEHAIVGSDISRRNINIARENITRSKLHRDIELEVMPIEEQHAVGESGIAIINPPYGKRMKTDEIDELYKLIGDTMKKNFKGYKFYIISSDFLALKRVGLKTSMRLNVFNGPLECKFLCFELYEGSKRAPREIVEGEVQPTIDSEGEAIVREDDGEVKVDNRKIPERRDSNDARGGGFGRGEGRDNRDRGEFNRDRKPFEGERRSFDRGDRKPFDGVRKPFDRGDRKPFEGERRSFDRGDRKPFEGERRSFDRGDRKPFEGERRSFDRGDRKPFDGERRSFDRGDRKPFEGERRSFDRGDRKPFDGERRSFDRGDRKPFEGEHRSFDRGDRKSFDGERKPFNRDENRGSGYGGDHKPFDRGEKRDSEPKKPYTTGFGSDSRTENKCKIYRKRRTE